jgi:DNA repair exonuclease SbcCD nuclease subunit
MPDPLTRPRSLAGPYETLRRLDQAPRSLLMKIKGIDGGIGLAQGASPLPPHDIMGSYVPKQNNIALSLEGDPVALGHAHLPDILHTLHLFYPQGGMAGILLV